MGQIPPAPLKFMPTYLYALRQRMEDFSKRRMGVDDGFKVIYACPTMNKCGDFGYEVGGVRSEKVTTQNPVFETFAI